MINILYNKMTAEALEAEKQKLQVAYNNFLSKKMSLDMSRGKPSDKQLDLCSEMFDTLNSDSNFVGADGIDCRNYGLLDGISEAKTLFSQVMGIGVANLIVCGNSSLNIMYDLISTAVTHGILGNTPWGKLDKVKFLCPVPGYDRHFAITEYFGIEMINIPMHSDGPDMDLIEKLVENDESIKGIWSIPKYSNPTGISYSDEVVRRFANLKPAAKDFRIFWDNAYAVHHLYRETHPTESILEIIYECKKAGNPNLVYKLCSTSKVSLPGGGISAVAASLDNIKEIKNRMSLQIISHDKVNQLRHARYFKDFAGIEAHMKKQAEVLRPNFESVLSIFESELKGTGCGNWTNPAGGYFISFNANKGCATKIIDMCADAGMKLTPAGATFPYGKDPDDCNIRIAPTYPTLEEITLAAELFTICVKLVSIEKLQNSKTV